MHFRIWLENPEFDDNEKYYLKSIFYMLVEHSKNLSNYYLELFEKSKKHFPYTGMVYRTMSIPIQTLQSWQLNNFPNLQQLQKDPSSFKRQNPVALEELKQYVLKMADFWSKPTDSWSKSMNGINYFQQNQKTRAYNVILKAHMTNGLDLYKLGQFAGVGPDSKEMRITAGAEEVVGHPEKIEIHKIHLLKNPKRIPKPSPYDLI